MKFTSNVATFSPTSDDQNSFFTKVRTSLKGSKFIAKTVKRIYAWGREPEKGSKYEKCRPLQQKSLTSICGDLNFHVFVFDILVGCLLLESANGPPDY